MEGMAPTAGDSPAPSPPQLAHLPREVHEKWEHLGDAKMQPHAAQGTTSGSGAVRCVGRKPNTFEPLAKNRHESAKARARCKQVSFKCVFPTFHAAVSRQRGSSFIYYYIIIFWGGGALCGEWLWNGDGIQIQCVRAKLL